MKTHENTDKLEEIIERLESIQSIPTMPAIAVHAMEATRNPNSSMKDIAKIISMDPPLAARVLKVVNSAYYGLSQSVGSLPLALTILGIDEIMNIVMTVTVMTIFPDSSVDGFFDPKVFWKHSASCAHTGKGLVERLGIPKLSSEAFVGGLLHDVGKILMNQYMNAEYREAMMLSAKEGIPSCDSESMIVGVTHTQLGAWLSRKWNLPERIVEGISLHHSPSRIPSDDQIKQIVYISNLFCNLVEQGKTPDEIVAALDNDDVWADFAGAVRRSFDLKSLVELLGGQLGTISYLLV